MANAIPVHADVDKEADVKSAPKSNKPAPTGAPKAPKADVKADVGIKMPDGSIRRDA